MSLTQGYKFMFTPNLFFSNVFVKIENMMQFYKQSECFSILYLYLFKKCLQVASCQGCKVVSYKLILNLASIAHYNTTCNLHQNFINT
ncbi:MAG TPA: hypothetical protein DEH02_10070 [Bacteroidales bacterium]|nr:MAG: hypothetical protein A2X01_03040 [Bacteroidetes bacterium GWF2_35_48]OFY95105.1 MAG: hypothetical protein A2491_18760 [Bacteroidetes bacterium RIFOXYC12_FULL_35_7]HBX51398.1 hypothetical protein [Bacteroidales bacterium]